MKLARDATEEISVPIIYCRELASLCPYCQDNSDFNTPGLIYGTVRL